MALRIEGVYGKINQNDREADVSDKTNLSYYNRFDGGTRLSAGAGYKFYSFKIYISSSTITPFQI